MPICTSCFNRNIYCIDCRDAAENCTYSDHKHKCLTCKKIMISEKPQKLKKITLCSICHTKEAFIKGKYKNKNTMLCDVCTFQAIKEKKFKST